MGNGLRYPLWASVSHFYQQITNKKEILAQGGYRSSFPRDFYRGICSLSVPDGPNISLMRVFFFLTKWYISYFCVGSRDEKTKIKIRYILVLYILMYSLYCFFFLK